ncbi:conserved hypothetical protein [Frankia canadensis]|uniref:MoxR-like ATPase n=1 Tax=Frankia canadensis TaxID=1836972 RepID=A0A2I2KP91_9ACTN|nr:MoxR family ATPase [Frankia canadensis]SNQ47470.1 conserved hypothetical protein [Frankia canadensis]SOU54760.1 conserved hypothetical protein [Frankia canadensis]
MVTSSPPDRPGLTSTDYRHLFDDLADNVEQRVRGKAEVVRLALTCLLARGHLLLEDVPGVGKTLLARSIAESVGLTFARVQFTADLLPADITGAEVYDQARNVFEFRAGPLFANVVLADEVNRASPKTQSALLEAMEEGQVTVAGTPVALPDPFVVIATQNPVEMAGTYPLPEAQLDRFLLRTRLEYPDPVAEVNILRDHHEGRHGAALPVALRAGQIRALLAFTRRVEVSDQVLRYIVEVVAATRAAPGVALGASPRAGVALLRAARVRAAADGRGYVDPGDVKDLAVPVLAHRLILDAAGMDGGVLGMERSIVADIVRRVRIPRGFG